MRLTTEDATELAVRVLTRYGVSARCAAMAAEHLVDAALSGHEFASLARLPTLAKLLQDRPPAREIRVVKEPRIRPPRICPIAVEMLSNIIWISFESIAGTA